MPFTETASSVWFEQQGAGEDVLLISGLPGAGETWDVLFPHLVAANYRVTRYDARGTGRSKTFARPFWLTDLVDDALAVRDAAEIDAAHVLGAGLGGVLAQHLALADPTRVRSLGLIGSWAAADRQLRAILGSWAWAAQRAQTVDELYGVIAASAFSPSQWEDGTTDDTIVQAVSETSAADFRRLRAVFLATVWAALEHDLRTEFSRLDVPTLLLVGALDGVAPERHSQSLLELLPQAQLEVVADAGHALLHSRPERVSATLHRFLRTPAFA